MGPSTITVLVVDPYKEDREYWVHRLNVSSPEYRVLEADTGRTALTFCKSQRVDCVVTELSLPDMSGFEVLVSLVPRANCPTIAVIVLTRLIMYPLIGIAMRYGAQAYLIKSRSSGDDLVRAIHKAFPLLGATT